MNNTRIYGRAQRIEFYKKVGIFVGIALIIMLVFYIVMNHKEKVDDNVDFAYLREYMEANGYSCEMIHHANGKCVLKGENSTSTFFRYEDGFEFIVRSDVYNLNIKHVSTATDHIIFKTTSKALSGYKNQTYTCKTKDNILGQLKSCVDDSGNELTANAYKGVIELAIKDLNNFINSSGYDKDKLLNENEWIKKTK